MDLKKLLEQQSALAKQIEEALSAERPAKIAEVKAIVELYKLTPIDIFENFQAAAHVVEDAAKKKVDPKYRNPNGPETWTGRGVAPKWIAAVPKAERDRFLIK